MKEREYLRENFRAHVLRGKNYNNMKGRGKLKRGHVLGGMPYPLNKKRKREGEREVGCVRLFYPLHTCDVFYLFGLLGFILL